MVEARASAGRVGMGMDRGIADMRRSGEMMSYPANMRRANVSAAMRSREVCATNAGGREMWRGGMSTTTDMRGREMRPAAAWMASAPPSGMAAATWVTPTTRLGKSSCGRRAKHQGN